jgi:hypothetical protein
MVMPSHFLKWLHKFIFPCAVHKRGPTLILSCALSYFEIFASQSIRHCLVLLSYWFSDCMGTLKSCPVSHRGSEHMLQMLRRDKGKADELPCFCLGRFLTHVNDLNTHFSRVWVPFSFHCGSLKVTSLANWGSLQSSLSLQSWLLLWLSFSLFLASGDLF